LDSQGDLQNIGGLSYLVEVVNSVPLHSLRTSSALRGCIAVTPCQHPKAPKGSTQIQPYARRAFVVGSCPIVLGSSLMFVFAVVGLMVVGTVVVVVHS